MTIPQDRRSKPHAGISGPATRLIIGDDHRGRRRARRSPSSGREDDRDLARVSRSSRSSFSISDGHSSCWARSSIVAARQCRQSHRRSRWPRDCAGDDRRGELRLHFLSRGKRGVRGISADPLCRRHRASWRYWCGAVIGASLGFSGSTHRQRSIFMGDAPARCALGGLLGAIAVAIKHEIVLCVLSAALFVLEACFGHRAGRLVQGIRQARIQNGADSPPLRAARLGRSRKS